MRIRIDEPTNTVRAATRATLALALVVALGAAAPVDPDAGPCDTPQGHRFDFWPGWWHVDSELRMPDGSWSATRNVWFARAELDGCAFLDFADGDFGGGRMAGIGSRYYDPDSDRWSITWLSTDSPGRLGVWTGRFDDGRGDFLRTVETPGGTVTSRISWFDLREDSVGWEFAISRDAGENWQPLWRMTFRRCAGAPRGPGHAPADAPAGCAVATSP